MASSAGTKTTTDPRSSGELKNENPGVVTSDSLAGESIKTGGSFAANSDARGVSSQPSHSTTTNNTDISGATKLDSTPSRSLRGDGASDDIGSERTASDSFAQSEVPDDAPNASFETDIGGKDDPGRAAVGDFQAKNVPVAGGAGPREESLTSAQQFGSLDETNA